MPKGKLMKRFVLLLVAVFALAFSCVADSITINQPGGFFESYPYSYIYGGASNGTSGAEFDLSGSQKSLAGWLYSYSATSYIDGSLSNGFFNTKTDVLKAQFSGYSYNWSTGQFALFSGTFVEHFNINANYGSWQSGTLGNGYLITGTRGGLTTPEPGTLSLLATGIIGMAFTVRKKVRQHQVAANRSGARSDAQSSWLPRQDISPRRKFSPKE
jgi:hypothetical protein